MKLSALQRFILEKAAKQNRVYCVEVKAEFFKLQPNRQLRRHEKDDPATETKAGDLFSPGSHAFDMKQIGQGKYRSVSASLSRAIRRLQERGLVNWIEGYSRWTACTITESGRASVNTLAKLPKC